MEKIMFNKTDNKHVQRIEITEKSEPLLFEETKGARSRLIDVLSSYDDSLANLIINSESLDSVTIVDVVKALRQVTLSQVLITSLFIF